MVQQGMRSKPSVASLMATVCYMAFGSQAVAQTAPEEVGEVIVTATRRAERLQDVPASIQAIGGEELQRTGAVDFADYGRTVAGVSFIDSGPGRAQIFIRGVSTGGDASTGKEATVGVYIDETPVSEGSSQPDLKLYDIDRIEVLRGPQGTLYGSGSLGGTLRVITRQPEFSGVSGYVQGLLSGTEEGGANQSANGWINVPLSDTLALRAVAYAVHNDGFLDDAYGTPRKDINDEDTYGGRVAVRAKPSDALDVVLTGIYQRTTAGAYYRVTDTYPDLVILQSAPEPFRDRYGVVNLKVDYDFGVATLTSSTSVFDRRRYFENDIDYFLGALGIPEGDSRLTYDAKATVQEVRLASNGEGRLRWVVGAFFTDRDDDYHQTINFRGAPPPATPGDNLFLADTLATTKQTAGFGEVSFDFAPKLTATVGVRVSRTDRSTEAIKDGLVLGGRSVLTGDFEETSTTPKFNLSYKPNDDVLLYLQAAKGFRIGGVNPGLPPCAATPGCTIDVGDSFGSDSLWNYEVGAKLQLLERRLTVNASAFYIDWSDIQLNVSRGDGFDGFLNSGDAKSKGVEVEVRARLTEQLRIGGQVTYTDAKLGALPASLAGVATSGARIPDVARWNAAANMEWGTTVWGDGYFYARGDLQYVGDRTTSLGPTAEALGEYALVNLR
ncbi:MAG TPA: TonB-dependent receptor, partial [Lysobacter sp.]